MTRKAIPKARRCLECDGVGTSYVDHTKKPGHPYRVDHMNAHICTKCHGSGQAPSKEPEQR